MRIELDAVGKGRAGRILPPASAVWESGTATLVGAETEQRPSVLGLIASGRMRPDTGEVRIDGRTDARALRRRVALIDAPDVSDPHPDVTTAGVVAEELMFAGRASNPIAAVHWLRSHGLGALAPAPFGTVAPVWRLRILCELALLRPGVEGIVLVSPDRHGGNPRGWWYLAHEIAERGIAVLVIAGEAARLVLTEHVAEVRA